MRVRMSTGMSDAETRTAVEAGDVVDVPDELGRRLVERGSAEEVLEEGPRRAAPAGRRERAVRGSRETR
jgi:hypothetical protein